MAQQHAQLTPRPFVKWAGGKRQLIQSLASRLPGSFGAYIEPFLGGGAMAFHMLSERPPQRCALSDLNSDLVLAYVTVRDRVGELVSSLRGHSRAYAQDPNAYYYAVRASAPRSQVAKASRLLFLNRTCFNGLYRVNSGGRFNVPHGRYANPNIVNEEALHAASRALSSRRVTIECGDFASASRSAEKGDLVYFDPPYQPVSQTARFTSYTRMDFGERDLARLARTCEDLSARGCHVLLSNSDTPQVRSLFGRGWRIAKVSANRVINSNGDRRAGHAELLISNY